MVRQLEIEIKTDYTYIDIINIYILKVIGGQNKLKTPELRIFEEMQNEDLWREPLQNVR